MFVIRERLYVHPVVITMSSIVLLIPNVNFWVVPLLHSLSGIPTWGTSWLSWMSHCATSRKVASSICDDVGTFDWQNPSYRTMALGWTQSLTEIFLGGKGDRCVGLTTLPPSCVDRLEIWEPQPPGSMGLNIPPKGLFYLHFPLHATCPRISSYT